MVIKTCLIRLWPLCTVAVLAACSPNGAELYARAEKSLAEGDVRPAIIALNNLVKSEPRNAKARALLATAQARSGDMIAAAAELQKAKNLGATPDELLVPECRVMLDRSEFKEMLEHCKPEGRTGETKVEMQIATGRALIQLGDVNGAMPVFQAAWSAKPDSVDAFLGLVGANYATGGLAAAKTWIAKATPKIQESPQFWMAIGVFNFQAGEYQAAEDAYRKAIEAAKSKADAVEHLRALGALAEAQLRAGKVKEADETAQLLARAAPNHPLVKQLRGQIAMAAGKYDDARALFEEAVAAMPGSYEARTLLGIAHLQLGNLGQAEMHFQNVLANRPNDARAQRLLALTRSRESNPSEAMASLKSTLRSDNADPVLLAMAGQTSLAGGDRQQGMTYLSEASERAASDQSGNTQLQVANVYLMAGDVDRALEILDKMPDDGATGLRRDYMLLVALLRKGDTEQLVAQANQLVAKRGSDPKVRNFVGGILAAAGQRAEARTQFDAALKLKPNDPMTLVSLGRLDLTEQKPDDAAKNFQQALKAEPKDMLATMGLAYVAAAKGNMADAEKWMRKASEEHADSVDAQLALTQFYVKTGKYDQAKKVIDAAQSRWPKDAVVANARGQVHIGLHDIPGAIASFKQATTLAPRALGYSMNLSRAYVANGDLPNAFSVLDDILKIEPAYKPALMSGTAFAIRGNQLERAAGYAARLRQAYPDAQTTYMVDGELALAQKQYKQAADSFRKAAAKGPNTAEIVTKIYHASQLAGESKPEKVLEDWLARNPGDVLVTLALGQHRTGQGDVQGAIAAYESALKGSPNNALLLNNLAMAYDSRQDKRALATGEQAYKAAPNVVEIQDTYGWLLARNGQADKAIDILRSALKVLPQNAELQYHLAYALAKTGKKAEAVDLLQKAMKGTLPPAAKADAQQLLAQLSK